MPFTTNLIGQLMTCTGIISINAMLTSLNSQINSPEISALIVIVDVLKSLAINKAGESVKSSSIADRAKEEIILNHHLTRAVGNTIAFIVEKAASDGCYNEEEKRILREAAKYIRDHWPEMRAKLGEKTYSAIDEYNIPRILSGDRNEFKKVVVLNQPAWKAVMSIAFMGAEINPRPKYNDHLMIDISQRLCTEFAKTIFDILANDIGTDPDAYAKIVLRMLGEILSSVNECQELGKGILNKVTTLDGKVTAILDLLTGMYSIIIMNYNMVESILTDKYELLQTMMVSMSTEMVVVRKLLELMIDQQRDRFEEPTLTYISSKENPGEFTPQRRLSVLKLYEAATCDDEIMIADNQDSTDEFNSYMQHTVCDDQLPPYYEEIWTLYGTNTDVYGFIFSNLDKKRGIVMIWMFVCATFLNRMNYKPQQVVSFVPKDGPFKGYPPELCIRINKSLLEHAKRNDARLMTFEIDIEYDQEGNLVCTADGEARIIYFKQLCKAIADSMEMPLHIYWIDYTYTAPIREVIRPMGLFCIPIVDAVANRFASGENIKDIVRVVIHAQYEGYLCVNDYDEKPQYVVQSEEYLSALDLFCKQEDTVIIARSSDDFLRRYSKRKKRWRLQEDDADILYKLE